MQADSASPDTRAIGSDFELVGTEYLVETPHERLPWDSDTTTYVGSGRQALTAAASALWRRGYREIHVPEYLCDSMVEPFLAGGWAVTPLKVTKMLEVAPTAVAGLSQTVILNAPYFGRPNPQGMTSALRVARENGAVVIADETHRVLDSPICEADVRVASLRKLLPIFDGGYVVGISPDALPMKSSDEGLAARRQRAMRKKTFHLAAGTWQDTHLEELRETEALLAARLSPTAMSTLSRRLLERLNLNAMRRRRWANAIVLADALGRHPGFRILNPPHSGFTPSHLILNLPDPYALRAYLARHQIYCPVHWPPSRLIDTAGPWPQSFISLPVDHRYVAADMRRLSQLVHQYFAGASAQC